MADPAVNYFSCTDKERAIFEAGIKLGSIYHQYTGIPINENNVDSLERAIEKATTAQPFVSKVKIAIDRRKIGMAKSSYKYKTLVGDMMDVKVVIKYGTAVVEGKLAWIRSMRYPLMRFKVLKE